MATDSDYRIRFIRGGRLIMRWSQIKTIFILCFIALNIYLMIQYVEKREKIGANVLEREESTIEDQLEADNIKYGELPEVDLEESFISVEQKQFTKEELAELVQLKNQRTSTIINQRLIISQYDKPIAIEEDQTDAEIYDLIKESFLYSDEYLFWNWNKEMNVLMFFQKELERPIYFNNSGLVLVFLDENDETLFYIQTMLGEVESRRDQQSLIRPIDAIETLYNNHELFQDDEITKVEIGFHTRVPLDDGIQVFVPTWKITVNHERRYFVNALEGFVFASNERVFIEEVIETIKERVEILEKDEILKENILSFLRGKLEK